MRICAVIFFVCLALPAHAQRVDREAPRTSRPKLSRPLEPGQDISRKALATRGKGNMAEAPADLRLPQAPGLVQFNYSDTNRTAWFVVTERIPWGTTFRFQMYPPIGSQSKPLEVTVKADAEDGEDLLPGSDYLLPQIPDFGDFWINGYVTYNMVVETPNGNRSHSAAEFRINYPQRYEDLLSPVIFAINSNIVNRDILLTIEGAFEPDPVVIAIDNYVVPSDAITRPSEEVIRVNLRRVPGFSLDLRRDYLVTVGQIGWTDTRVYAHVPYPPGQYWPQ
jgi:hypothetical protein